MSRGAGLCLFSPKMSDDMVETARSWGMEEHSLNLFQGMESSRSWGCHHSDIGDNLGKTVFTYLSTELLASMCSCCDIAYAFVSCEALPEADGNEYVSGFCFVLLHGFSCYNQKLPIVYHVEWLLAIVPCKYTLEWTCLFFCASSTFTQNEQLWGDFLSEKSLTFELVFISWSKLLCLWDIKHSLCFVKSQGCWQALCCSCMNVIFFLGIIQVLISIF